MRLLLPALGSLLLLLLAIDVSLTIFHASRRGGGVNQTQNRMVWRAFRRMGIRRGSPRSVVLEFAGPTLVATTLVVWPAWLILGFALIYLPFIHTFLVAPGSLRGPWVEAFAHSLYTTSTLGLGDLIPDTAALRLVTGVQAMSGFALLSLSITYLLSVYSELISTRAIASQIDGYFREGTEETLDAVETTGPEAFFRWSEAVTAALLSTTEAQQQHPVLNYFRSTDHSRALPVQVGHLLEMRRSLARPDASPFRKNLAAHPSYLGLLDAIEKYFAALDENFIPKRFSVPSARTEDVGLERIHLRLLAYVGYPLPPADRV